MNLGSIKDKTFKRKSAHRILTASAFVCAAVVAVTAAVALSGRDSTQQLVLEAPKATDKPAGNQNVQVTVKPTSGTSDTTLPTPAPAGQDKEASADATVSKTTMLLPLAGGNVLKGYASDRLLYSTTLKHWSTHTGLDLASSAGTPVLAVLDGTVVKVEEDPLMGVTVTLEHEDGLQTYYASLEKAKDDLKVGDSVLRGQEIGFVGASASCEAEDGAHLHFEVLVQGEQVNPQTYLSGLIK